MDEFVLLLDGQQFVVLYLLFYVFSQFVVQSVVGGMLCELIDIMKLVYMVYDWIVLKIVQVLFLYGVGVIYVKYYGLVNEIDVLVLCLVVIFVYGVGYIQDVMLGFIYYFCEQMFYNWFVQKGYVVLDMDYCVLEGYGCVWCIVIY